MQHPLKLTMAAVLILGPSTQVMAQEIPAANEPVQLTQLSATPDAQRKATPAAVPSLKPDATAPSSQQPQDGYVVGINDVLEISVLEPEEILREVKVAPDGTITFPYIGSIKVNGLNIPVIQQKVHDALSNGYLKYPVVLVSLRESNSKQYMVYGEVNRPGAYPLEEYSTVLRAVSMAGGFTKFGSSSRVKVLRPRTGGPGYDTIPININKVMSGDSTQDIQLKAGDMVVISEGVF